MHIDDHTRSMFQLWCFQRWDRDRWSCLYFVSTCFVVLTTQSYRQSKASYPEYLGLFQVNFKFYGINSLALGNVATFWKISFSNKLYSIVPRSIAAKLLTSEYHCMSLIKINIGSGNGLVTWRNKPLSKPPWDPVKLATMKPRHCGLFVMNIALTKPVDVSPIQNGRHSADDIFICISVHENVINSTKMIKVCF